MLKFSSDQMQALEQGVLERKRRRLEKHLVEQFPASFGSLSAQERERRLAVLSQSFFTLDVTDEAHQRAFAVLLMTADASLQAVDRRQTFYELLTDLDRPAASRIRLLQMHLGHSR